MGRGDLHLKAGEAVLAAGGALHEDWPGIYYYYYYHFYYHTVASFRFYPLLGFNYFFTFDFLKDLVYHPFGSCIAPQKISSISHAPVLCF